MSRATGERKGTESATGRRVDSIWTSEGSANRFDLFIEATPPDRGRVVRIDGADEALRSRGDGARFANGGFVEAVAPLHHKLLAGDAGRRIVGSSGLSLLSNLMQGAVVALKRKVGLPLHSREKVR